MSNRAQPNSTSDVIGQNVVQLLSQIDEQVADATYRNMLQQSLQQLTDLKFALDASSIVALTDKQGKILYVNDKFCEISQYKRDELLGQDHRIVNSGYHPQTFMKKMWKTIGTGQVWRGEIRNRAKDGSYYWVDTTIVPLLGADRRPQQYLAVRNEVTRLKRVEEELQRMMAKVMRIQEEERKRFSRELHDGIGQSLFSLLIQLDRMLQERYDPELEQRRQDVTRIMEEVRGLSWELRPSVLDDLGVIPALRTYIDHFAQHYGIRVELDCDLHKRLDPQEETAVYRIIQEALTNVAKYAQVTEARVSLRETDAYIEAIVTDNGVGFVREQSAKGVGLFSMEERARAIDGELHIESNPGEGTRVRLTLRKKPKSDPLNAIHGARL